MSWRTAVAILLLVAGVNLVASDSEIQGLIGGGCLGAFAGMAVWR